MLLRTLPRPENFIPLPREIIETDLASAFERQVARQPQQIAVSFEQSTLSYAQANRNANRIAHAILQQAGPAPIYPQNQAVCIQVSDGALGVVAMLGVLKAGRIFAYLDIDDPPTRLERLCQDCQATLILADSSQKSNLAAAIPSGQTVIWIDELDPDLPDHDPSLDIPPQALSLLLYTSGSTGVPKGVMHTHRNILHAAWSENLHSAVTCGDCCGIVLPLNFGGSLLQVFSSLTLGAEVHIYDLRRRGIDDMPDWFRRQHITFANITATTLRQFCRAIGSGADFPDLRLVLTGGETVHASDVALFRQAFPEHVFLRLGGGSSEALWVAECFVDRAGLGDAKNAPFGYPFPDTEVIIWDEDGRELPPGQVGEMIVRSRYLSPGYWRQPELTAQVFLPDPQDSRSRCYRSGDLGRWLPSGLLEHLGRKDHLLKIRGVRVDPGEIEAALLALPGVQEAVVAGKPDRNGELRLIAYLVLEHASDWDAARLRHALSESLPNALTPARFIFLQALPLNAARKVDRSALPDPSNERPLLSVTYEKPDNDVESALACLWAEILEIDCVGVNDPFPALGGDSLRAMRILGKLNHLVSSPISLGQFLKAGTVRRLAELIKAQEAR